jgi:hypothetical protein
MFESCELVTIEQDMCYWVALEDVCLNRANWLQIEQDVL